MPIADTNPHSSMVDEDGNERVPESILLGTVSEDGRGHVGARSLLRGVRAQFNKRLKETLRARISSVIFQFFFGQDKETYLALE